MAILEELLVRLGVDLAGAEGEIDSSADRIDQALDDVEKSAQSLGDSVADAAGDTAAALDDVAASADGVAGEAEQAANDVEGALSGIAAGAAGAAVGALFMEGLDSALDMSTATTTLEHGFGLSAEEAARAGDLAGEVFSAGFSDSVSGASDAVGNVIGAVGNMGDVTDDELKQMTKSAIALQDVFGMDLPEATTAAGALIKQGLVKDGTEAFDVLTKAAQTLPASMAADIPAIVTEYGTHFARIGLDAQTAFGMMSQFVQAGGRDIDQAADVLHEFARITSEETDRAAEGFKALGLDANKMLTDIGKGGQPAADALGLTLEKLRGVEDPAQRAQLQVALFGDMAGEAADALLAMDPATASAATGMDQAAGAASRVTEGLEGSPAMQFEQVMRSLSETLGQALLPVLTLVSEFFREHPELLKVLVPLVLLLAGALAVAAAAQWVMNSALLANPITLIVLLIIALITLLVVLWQRSETFRDIVTGVWGAVKDFITAQVQMIIDVIGWMAKIPERVTGWFSDMKDGAIDMALDLVAWLQGLPGRVAKAVSGLFDGIPDSFRGAINSVIGWWNNMSFTIGGGSIMGVDIPSITLSTPDIPYLAEGGIVTRPTLAMVGEGGEDEAVMPLSKLQRLLDSSSPVGRKVQPVTTRVVFDVTGADEDMKRLISRIIAVDYGGDPGTAFT